MTAYWHHPKDVSFSPVVLGQRVFYWWCAEHGDNLGGESPLCSVTQYLQDRLKFVISTEKSQIVKTAASKFLGFTFRSDCIKWHPKMLRKFKQRIQALANRNRGLACTTSSLKSFSLYAARSNTLVSPIATNCAVIWIAGCTAEFERVTGGNGKPRTKVRNLMRLGVHVQAAVACGTKSKGPWHRSKTPGVNQALSSEFLRGAG